MFGQAMNSIIRTDGSGRRTVGKMVAGKLGISCYDSEWIEKISSQSGFVPAYMRGTEEVRIREKDKRRAASRCPPDAASTQAKESLTWWASESARVLQVVQ